MRHPQTILPVSFRTIHKHRGKERHPSSMFIQLLPIQNTPHDYSHAHKMAFKIDLDKEKQTLMLHTGAYMQKQKSRQYEFVIV